VAAQVGFAFVLLVGAGLLLLSFTKLLRVDPGFDSRGVLTVSTTASRARYENNAQLRSLMNRSLEAIRRLPGVAAAGATSTIPLSGNYNDSVILAEGYVMKPGESLISPRYVTVTPGYFEAMRIGLVNGRYLNDGDTESSERVIVIDERLARRFWPRGDAVGRRMYQPSSADDLMKITEKTRWFRIVGVVRSIRLENLDGSGNPVGAYYFPYAQNVTRGFTFAVKTSGDAGALASAVRGELARIDPQLALFDVRTMPERTELSLAPRRTAMTLATGFGALALFLAAIGLYGVLAYLIAQRRREIGIRVALGSTAGGILRLVLREGMVLVVTGIVAGLGGAYALRHAVAKEIYDVAPLDPFVLGMMMGLLSAVALAACAGPARRALQVDPAAVLNDQ
jgi:predicted permease